MLLLVPNRNYRCNTTIWNVCLHYNQKNDHTKPNKWPIKSMTETSVITCLCLVIRHCRSNVAWWRTLLSRWVARYFTSQTQSTTDTQPVFHNRVSAETRLYNITSVDTSQTTWSRQVKILWKFTTNQLHVLHVSPQHNRLHVTNKAFSIAGPRAWKALPSHIKLISSRISFCKKLKTHFFSLL